MDASTWRTGWAESANIMKNLREVIVLVPVRAHIYEDEQGELVCGRAQWPGLDDVLKAYLKDPKRGEETKSDHAAARKPS